MASQQGFGGVAGRVTPSAKERTVYRNPAFDARITSSGAVGKDGKFQAARKKLYRGRLETVPTPGLGTNAIYQLQFLYNPTSVQHTSGMDPQYLATEVAKADPNARGDASAFMQINQNISFNLLFDRTYETWVQNGSYLANWGVLADIKVLYAMLGMFAPTTISGSGPDRTVTISDDKSIEPQEVMQMTPSSAHQFRPVWAVFGPRLTYYGNITNFSVDYSHFTQNMVPNRCAVQINMQLIPKTTTRSSTSSAVRAAEKAVAKATGKASTHINRGQFGP